MAQVFGQAFLKHRRIHGREDAGLLGAPQAAGVDGDEQVRRAELALGFDALDQRVGISLDAIDLDAGFPREILIERKVGVIMARGVDVDFTGGGRGCLAPLPALFGAGGKQDEGGAGEGGQIQAFHGERLSG